MTIDHPSLTANMRPENVKIFTVFVFLISIIAFDRAAHSALIFEYETTLEIDAGAGGKVHPTDVSCDPISGEVCVTDVRQSCFHVFNGRHVQLFRTGPLATVSWPASGCLDHDGTLLFTDTAGGARYVIRRLDIFGEPAEFSATPPRDDWSPRQLTVMADGDYLSLDMHMGVLARHARDGGALIWSVRIGDPAARDTRFGRPAEAPDGRIYIPGGDQRKVFVISADGEPLGAFGEFGSAPGHMVVPAGVVPGPHGTILVLDRLRAKILAFDSDHVFLREFGTVGYHPGHFYHPSSIATNGDSEDYRIYVAQGYLGRVQVFRVFESSDQGAEKSASRHAASGWKRNATGDIVDSGGPATSPLIDIRAGCERAKRVAAAPAAGHSLNSEAVQ